MGKFDVLFHLDGNEATPEEFEATQGNDGKFFFRAADDATKQDKDRVKVLNFVHRILEPSMKRIIPAGVNESEEIEVLHAEDFQGLHLQVCVVYRGKKRCYATVKIVDNEGKDVTYEDTSAGDGNISTEKTGTNVKKNKHTKGGALIKDEKVNGAVTVEPLAVKEVLPGALGVKTRPQSYINHDWVPRWSPLVSALKDRMYFDFNKYGQEMYQVVEDDYDSEAEEAAASGKYVPTGSQEETEDKMDIFCGCIGKIIGPKGETLYKIQDATHVKIQMPPKNEDGPRPRARDLAEITIKGTQDNVEKAKAMVQALLDEWSNAPRGGGDRQQFHSAPVDDAPQNVDIDLTPGDWGSSVTVEAENGDGGAGDQW